MKSLFTASLLGLFLSGCTVYKSEGRKQFESQAPAKISASSVQLVGCKTENKIQTWLNDEFPPENYELVLADADLEIWRTLRAGGGIEVKAMQREITKTHSCIYHFANEIVWELHKPQFIKELQNNWMTE